MGASPKSRRRGAQYRSLRARKKKNRTVLEGGCPAAVLYLLRFSGDVVTAEQTFVTGVVTPVRVVAAEILVTLAEVVRIDVVRPAPVRLAIICLAVLRGGSDR